jgi:general secretion pathway protein E
VLVVPRESDELVGPARRRGPGGLLEVRRHLGRLFRVERADAVTFDGYLQTRYALSQSAAGLAGAIDRNDDLDALASGIPTAEDLLDSADDAPVIRLINGILAEAIRDGVSDVHVEPYESGLIVRMRVDGVLRESLSMPAHVAPVVISRIKVMARLDIAERRVPQDGRISLTLGGKVLDVRVSTLPSRAGERVVLRILDKEAAGFTLDGLGLDQKTEAILHDALGEPNGIILVTGPTGSGKTTTLYACLQQLNDGSRNILTVEDPVEYAIDGVGQTQVNAKVGMTFATGLRAILRQDPDVVMVGEIRDRETAEIAVQASLTGHLVLSTVHTNDAIGAITRLRDMKVEQFLLASTLRAVIAQRLPAALARFCRAREPASAGLGSLLGLGPNDIVYRPVGCPECGHSGYKGRMGVFEAVRIDPTVRKMINEGAEEAAIARHAFRHAPNLSAAARELVLKGETTPEEAIRVSRRDEVSIQVCLSCRRSAGRERRGSVQAISPDSARASLESRKLYVLKLAPGSEEQKASRKQDWLPDFLKTKRLSAKQLTLFTRQLATMTKVSPLEEALRIISRQSEQEHVRAAVTRVADGVVEGRRLVDAMAAEPRSFPPLYRAMVAAGETSGSLPELLERLAKLLERQSEMRGKVLSALAYPAVLTLVAIVVVSALMIAVVPKVVEQFDDVGQQLPR